MDGWVDHGRDRTINSVRAQQASYHCATGASRKNSVSLIILFHRTVKVENLRKKWPALIHPACRMRHPSSILSWDPRNFNRANSTIFSSLTYYCSTHWKPHYILPH
ncbi:hypothetical protein Y032_0025g1200 [Ancylostoma ceylanicum]|uniref:Uncharacterized protein n=1 Tax=Ancylostoma ceylanicum TaxID=53326 RepID=A0A016UXF5_9BILA|nr:hypothetical protein Y032_0025g1200 [Ancylostoma ceylanicum]